MAKTVWKFPLELERLTTVAMPAGARIISVGRQKAGVPTIWAEVDSEETAKEIRVFLIVGTGHPLPEIDLAFVGTVFDEPFVWHIYETDMIIDEARRADATEK